MSNTTPLNVQLLDFDLLKANLINYLQSQSQFRDYDFSGSGIQVLLDILAYNTHYNAFYMSMVANEMFLDSAQLRSSVVSLAKNLNYTPRSTTSAQAVISIVLTPTDSSTFAVIPANTTFTTNVNGTAYSYITRQAYSATIANGVFTFPNITLTEGRPYTYQYIVDSTIPDQRFVIPNTGVDTSTITVSVQQSATNTTKTTFTLTDNFLEIQSTTPAYFLQEVENQQYSVTFGDGIIGLPVVDGNVVIINYILSTGPLSNGATTFLPSIPLSGYPISNSVVTTLANSSGGALNETTDEIRFSAPKNYQAQRRAVIVSDYIFQITQNYPNADSVAVWGGEDMNPPQYGKVFISIKPVAGFVLTDTIKSLILQNIIRPYNIVSIIPKFVDPDYTFITVSSTVKYNPNNTSNTPGTVQAEVYSAVVNYANTNLDKFDLEFRYSKLLTIIDEADTSISSNLTTIQLKKIFAPALGFSDNYTFNLYNSIIPGSVTSTSFINVNDPLMLVPYVNGNTYILKDDSNGNMQIWVQGIGVVSQPVRNCGTINYDTGQIQLVQFMPFLADVNGNISIIMSPQENDIVPSQNNILFIKPQDVNITTSSS